MNYKLLIVDDEIAIINSLKRIFRAEQFDILTALDANAALDIIKTNNITVILTDNLMPEISGIELLSKVKEVSPNTVRIIMSGYSDMDDVLTALNDCEVYRFLLKPWNDIELKITINLAMAFYKLLEDKKALEQKVQKQNKFIKTIKEQYPELLTLDTENILN